MLHVLAGFDGVCVVERCRPAGSQSGFDSLKSSRGSQQTAAGCEQRMRWINTSSTHVRGKDGD